MEPIAVRQATLADAPAVHQMQIDWVAEDITNGLSADSVGYFEGLVGRYFLVAEADEGLVGFICGSVRTADDAGFVPDGEALFNIDDLYVEPESRDRGIGGRLMRDLMAVAEEDGIHRFAVSSNTKDMDRIIGFYQSCGFATWNVTMFR